MTRCGPAQNSGAAPPTESGAAPWTACSLLPLSSASLLALGSTRVLAYFKAFTAAELDLATLISKEERPDDRPGHSQLRRFATIRIAPAGDRLAKEHAAMRSQLVDLLGRPRGLTAAAVIGRQLGNQGRGGEVVGFSKYPGETLYRLQVDGLGDHALRAGSFGSAPTYERADFSELARYRHLGVLLRN